MAQFMETDLSASKNSGTDTPKGRQLDGQVIILMPDGKKLGIEITVSESVEHPKSKSGKDRFFITTKKYVSLGKTKSGKEVNVGISGTLNCDGLPQLLSEQESPIESD